MNENEDTLRTGLQVWAKVGVDLGSQLEKSRKVNDELWRRLQFGTPVLRRLAVSGVYPSSGYLTLNLGQPDNGTYWDLESVVVGGTDVNVTAAGSAGLYVTGGYTNVSPGLGNAVDFTSSLPNAAFYGFRDVFINDAETLTISIFNGTSGQVYVASVTATVYNTAAALGTTINAGS